MEIRGCGVLITGGGSGLGAATAEAVVTLGAKVTLLDIDRARGASMAEKLGSAAQFVCTDVTSEQEVKSAVEAHCTFAGGLHLVVNCAGVATPAKVLDREGVSKGLGHFRKVVEINLVGTFNVVQQSAVAMVKNTPNVEGERGVIVNTASVAATEGQVGQSAYSASKGAVASMTLPLAREFARHGIRVLTIAPGIFQTPMMSGLPDKVQASLAEQVPFPSRLGRPEEYASLVCHLAQNAMLNAEVIRLDGALRMAAK
ncbi:MAG: SDR family NAD(P)-dependent oxidoreductase [Myxococcota bacterium]